MKAAASMTTGKESYYGDPWPKWGEQQRVYYSSTAYVDYRLPTGYTGDTPLFGDLATVDVSAGQAPNGSTHDYNEVYDACEYVNPDLPYPAYPGILADVYPQINIGVGVRPGTYMQANHYAHMGCFMASIIMSDEAFWGGAVADFDRRWANDCQMWENFGINFDYSDIGSNGFRRDIHGFGGTGNQWMVDLWDDIS